MKSFAIRRQFTRRGGPFTILTAVAFIGAGSTILAQPFTVDWHTVDGGGAMNSIGGTFSLDGTIGQPDAQAAPVMTGGTFELTGGFWPVANVCYCLADMNGDSKKDGADVQQFAQCVLGGGNCSCADVDAAGGVTLDDVAVFVDDLVSGSMCP